MSAYNELKTEAASILFTVAKTLKSYPSRGKYNRVIGGYTKSQKDVMNDAINAVKNINVISQAMFRKDVVTFEEESVSLPNFTIAADDEEGA